MASADVDVCRPQARNAMAQLAPHHNTVSGRADSACASSGAFVLAHSLAKVTPV